MKRLDMLGSERGFSFKGTLSYKTTFGALFTIFYILCVIAGLIHFINRYNSREKRPSLLVEEINLETAPTVNFNYTKFFFTFTGVYDNRFILPEELEKIVEIKIEQFTTDVNKLAEIFYKAKEFQVRKCNEEDFIIEDELIVARPEISPCRYSLCVANNSLIIDDDLPEKNLKFAQISINRCKKIVDLILKRLLILINSTLY